MEKPDIPGLFEPENYSAALLFLRRLIGCTFDYVWTPGSGDGSGGGTCDNTNDVLAIVITTMNWAMLAVIAGVATYLIFAALKDTANDGEVGGRSMNPSWTLVMAGIAAILCFPAFNGFSALQMSTMKVAVWSTGLGDNLWRIGADKMANSTAVSRTFNSVGEGGWFWNADPATEAALRSQIATAMQDRVEGELCARMISMAAENMSTADAKLTPATTDHGVRDGHGSSSLFYQGGSGLNGSTGLCGRVNVRYVDEGVMTVEEGNTGIINGWGQGDYVPSNSEAQGRVAQELRKYLGAAAKAGGQAFLTSLNSEASKLTQKLFPLNEPRLRGEDQLKEITAATTAVIGATRRAMADALGDAPGAVQQATSDAMLRESESGWMYAVLYQRILVNATTGLSNLSRGSIEVSSVKPTGDIAAAFGCSMSSISFRPKCGDTIETFFGQYGADRAALEQLNGAFATAANGRAGVGTNAAQPGWTDLLAMTFPELMNHVVQKIAGTNESQGDGWSDPIPQLQATGGGFLSVGSALLAVSKTGEALSEWHVSNASGVGLVAGEVLQLVGPLGWLLVTLGFLLAVVVPFMPLVYFFLAALSWLVLAVQTIITAPFWLMQMFYPNRGGGISGTSVGRALTVLLGLLMRPALIIIGLILCMVLMRVGLDILNVFSRNAFAVMSVSGGQPLGSGVANLAVAIGGFFVYVSMCVALVSVCCGLIDGVSDFVMDMVETGTARMFGSEGRSRSEGMLGNPSAAAAAGVAFGGRGMLSGTASRIGRLSDKRSLGSNKEPPRSR